MTSPAVTVGLVGAGPRGRHLGGLAEEAGLRVGAVADVDAGARRAAAERFPGAAVGGDWRELLADAAGGGLDGVILAHDFDRHAGPAVAFLDRGVHVLAETAACVSEAEGRALVAAADRSAATYSFAENYVAHPHVVAARRALAAGEVGEPQLVECDYLHSMAPAETADFVGGPGTWRGRVGPTAYCTHSVAPILALCAPARPVEVSAFAVTPGERPLAVMLVLRFDTGALGVARHGFLAGEVGSHWCWLSVRGTAGVVESGREPDDRAWTVHRRVEAWASPDGATRLDDLPPAPGRGSLRDAGTRAVVEGFARTIREGAAPLVDVRMAVTASLVGVVAARSLADGSRPVRVPAA